MDDIILITKIQCKESSMPIIKPISDLRNKANEIADLVEKSQEPIYITKNGEGEMVIVSMRHYANLQKKIDLLGKLAAAQANRMSGDKGRPLRDVMSDLRKRLSENV